jgi:putative tributyrin esterase
MARFHVNMMSYTLRMATDLEVIIPSSPGWSRFVTPTITHKDFPEKFPCLYLLHGFASDYSWFLANTHIPEIAEKQNIAVVMPSGYNTAWEDEKYGLPHRF